MLKEVKFSTKPSLSTLSVAMSVIEYSLRVVSVSQELLILLFKIIFISLAATVRNILPKSKKNLKDEVVLITGSAHGLGKQLALDTAKLGAKVVLWDINQVRILIYTLLSALFLKFDIRFITVIKRRNKHQNFEFRICS